MGDLSLTKSIRTCSVDPGWASRSQSARFQNPELMVCPVWNGMNNLGQVVQPDTFMTKSAGCSNPMDRIEVENSLRPQYAEFINLDAAGIESSSPCATKASWVDAGRQQAAVDVAGETGPDFGLGFNGHVRTSCNDDTYATSLAQRAMPRRGACRCSAPM